MERMTVVITGSARGLGYEMARCFRKRNFNVVISDILLKDVKEAKENLLNEKGEGKVSGIVCDITNSEQLKKLIKEVQKEYQVIDYWINNAGVNQPDKLIWQLNDDEISKMIDIDLKGTILATKYVMEVMEKQGFGHIYMVEGHGSNDAIIPGLSIYGTAKRGVTYFTKALAKECAKSKLDIIVGLLSPGIMITDFTNKAFRDQTIKLSDKNKKVYNILGDYPSVVAKFLVRKMVNNTNNSVRIMWLTKGKAMWRFIRSIFYKRDFFKDK